MLLGRRCCGTPANHVVVARGRDVLGQLAAHRADVRNNLPDLKFGNLAPERWHSIRPSFNNGCGDVLGLAAIDPARVHQGWANAPASMKVTANAVVHLVKLLSLAHCIGAVFIRIGVRLALGGVSGSNVAHLHSFTGLVRRRGFAKIALLARAAGQQCQTMYRGRQNPQSGAEEANVHLSLASVWAGSYSGMEYARRI